MAVYIPPKQVLPVSKGGDLVVDFMYMVDDIYTNYAPGVIVRLEVDITPPTVSYGTPLPSTTVTALAVISTYHAVCKMESTVADAITDGSLWRAVVSYPTVPDSTEIIGMNGRIQRSDGN